MRKKMMSFSLFSYGYLCTYLIMLISLLSISFYILDMYFSLFLQICGQILYMFQGKDFRCR